MTRRSSAPRRPTVRITWIAALLLTMVLPMGTASAAPSQNACDTRTNNTYEKLIECVRVEGVRAHQAALQAAADANDGNRAAGTTGYEASVDYVVDTLEAAGWNVELDEFPFTYTAPATLQQIAPVISDLRHRRLHGHRLRHRDGIGHGRRPRAGATAGKHQWL